MTTTYHNDAAFKAAFLAEIGRHEQADAMLRGSYGGLVNGAFKGCAIGCSVFSLHRLQGQSADEAAENPMDHAKVAHDLGWPLWLAHLEDAIFERLPDELAKTWPRRLAEAIPVGVVIDETALARILVWSLTSERYGAIHATDNAKVQTWIRTIADTITAESDGTITADQRAAAANVAKDAWDTWATLSAWSAWSAWEAKDIWAVRAAWFAWSAWSTCDAGAARTAWDAWDARAPQAARPAKAVRDQFYPALSKFMLSVFRELR